jgi:hypothetical protein
VWINWGVASSWRREIAAQSAALHSRRGSVPQCRELEMVTVMMWGKPNANRQSPPPHTHRRPLNLVRRETTTYRERSGGIHCAINAIKIIIP